MDLSITLKGVKLNIRVTVLLETNKGFIFQNTGDGYYFPVGGRIKINENSIAAAKRELKEEVDIDIDNFEYVATIENFFMHNDMPYQEFNIVYYAKIDEVTLDDEFFAFDAESIKDVVIQPQCIKEMIIQRDFSQKHFIVKDY